MSNDNHHFKDYRITSPYGMRIHPIHRTERFHSGVDLVKPHRSPISAFVGGKVTWAKWGASGTGFGGFGNVAQVADKYDHNHIYAHLDEIRVREGQTIQKGEVVGLQGSTGQSTGSHLHYEVRTGGWGTHINPGEYLTKYEEMEKEDEKEVLKCRVLLDGKFVGEGVLHEGRSYLPVRVLENVKYVVQSWDGNTRTVYLRSVE